jgi:hypothetical protein
MACGETVTVNETYWTWCWAWFVPYPCKKTRTATKYRYDFMPTRTVSTWPFRCKWQGCCGNLLYEWSYFCWNGTGDSAWDQFNTFTQYFDSPAGSIGDCPFKPGQNE